MDVSKFSLEDKVAVIVGGAGDIGRAIALTLAGVGADVVIPDFHDCDILFKYLWNKF